jgi:SAM-dependent methyltransferase
VAAEQRHFWFRNRNRLIAWSIDRFFPGARSFLDVGCGTGGVPAYLSRQFPDMSVTAADLLEEGLRRARRRLNGVTVLQMDARRMPFDQEFDVVGSFDVLEHIEEDEAVLKQMHKAARPGGGIVVTVPQHQFLWSRQDEFSHHKRRYARADLMTKLSSAGFNVRHVTSFVTLLLPALLLSRLRSQDASTEFNPVAELRIGAMLNGLFGAVAGLERGLLTVGGRLPLGASLLVVGSRAER